MSNPSAGSSHVGVVGGGPAGAATAIRLARHGVRVTLTERADRTVPCWAEGLPPAIRPLLAELGVLDEMNRGPHLRAYGNESAWNGEVPTVRSFITDPHGSGWHIDREAFERMLLTVAERSGVCIRHDTAACDARFVVDATGRRALVARRSGVPRADTDPLLGAVAILEHGSASRRMRTALVEAREHGYWYSAPLPSGRAVFAFLTDPAVWAALRAGRFTAPHESWRGLLEHTRHTATRASGYDGIHSFALVAAGTSRLVQPYGRDWLAVGDAAACRDPLSSGGIYEAIRSGIRAGDAIVRHLGGDPVALEEYAADVAARFSRDLVRRRDVYACERRWTHAPFWSRRRQLHIPSAEPRSAAS